MNPLLLDFPEEFESERLLFRGPRAGDGAELNAAVCESLDELKPWMPWAQSAPSVEESEDVCRRSRVKFLAREDLMLQLRLKENGTVIGGSGLHRMDWNVPKFEIGYWLRTSFCGQGYMTEAVEAIARFALETLNAQRVEIRCDSRNERSARVALRAGFTLEGTLRHDSRDVGGALRDTQIYATVRDE